LVETLPATASSPYVVVSVGSYTCAIPLEYVVETMRPLPVEPIVDAPTFVRGLTVVRGVPVPVVDLAMGMGLAPSSATSRFVVLAVNGRNVALAVDEVVGLRRVASVRVDEMPPLLRHACGEVVAALGVLDAELLFVLEASRMLPEGDGALVSDDRAQP
jgi:purine-binding chemotaxis protein CheW